MTRGDDTCVIFFLKDCSEGIKKPFSVLGKVLRKDTSSRNGSGIHVFTDESSSELDVRLRETNFGLILYAFDCISPSPSRHQGAKTCLVSVQPVLLKDILGLDTAPCVCVIEIFFVHSHPLQISPFSSSFALPA